MELAPKETISEATRSERPLCSSQGFVVCGTSGFAAAPSLVADCDRVSPRLTIRTSTLLFSSARELSYDHRIRLSIAEGVMILRTGT